MTNDVSHTSRGNELHISRHGSSAWASVEHIDIPFFDDVPSSLSEPESSFSPDLLGHPLWGSAERRRRIHTMRRRAGLLLVTEAVGRCGGYVSSATKDDVGRKWACVYKGERSAFFGHTISCGSVWHCPYCAARIARQRQQEVAETMRRHLAVGGHVWMATFTVPHHRFQSCKELRDAVALAFRKLQSGRRWMAWRERAGVVGVVRSMEVTHGGSGWHPHLHVLFFLDCHPSVADDFSGFLFGEWSRVVRAIGLGECSEGAWNWRFCNSPSTAGDYVAKWGADWELTHGHNKLGRHRPGAVISNRSPWEILQDFVVEGWPGDGELFREYAAAFKGARQLTWSRGLKAVYSIEDVDDQEVVSALEETESEAILAVEEPAVRALNEMGKVCDLLEAVERGGYDGGLNFMWGLGLHSFVAPPRKVLNGVFCLPKVINDVSRSSLNSPKRAPHRGNDSEDENGEDLFRLD